MAPRDVSERIQSQLTLDTPPVGLAFVQEPPSGVRVEEATVPSACTLWRRAERGLFYAAAEQHLNCQVGAMVMGFELPAAVQEELGGLVQTMCANNYLTAEEGDKIPSMRGQAAGIVYGPLAAFSSTPDVVILWLTPKQAMLYSEAAGTASWAAPPSSATGRPACSTLPLAIQGGEPRLSLGCMGMRTFTEVADDRLLAAIPGSGLDEFVVALDRMLAANQFMESYYQQRKATVGGGA
jgi:uncharacterized protein (DUF169 family)